MYIIKDYKKTTNKKMNTLKQNTIKNTIKRLIRLTIKVRNNWLWSNTMHSTSFCNYVIMYSRLYLI